jgi:hypothetical protein
LSAPQGPAPFIRDVGVNGLANLVAAAVLWLGAVAVGFIKSQDPRIIFVTLASAGLVAIVFALSASGLGRLGPSRTTTRRP